jgi:NhaP-type Na+/H+ or K+/H+ antiporter
MSAPAFRPLAILSLAVLAYSTAVLAGTNGFVAAFVAGMAFGTIDRHGDEEPLAYTQETGTALSLLVWFLFGAAMLIPGLEDAGWRDVVFALLALTVVRMVPVALALIGAGLSRPTVAFIGWFGPRGLASVVFGLIAFDTLDPAESKVVLAAVTVTVGASVLLHGLSASPLAGRYGEMSRNIHPERREHTETAALPTRNLRPRLGPRTQAKDQLA